MTPSDETIRLIAEAQGRPAADVATVFANAALPKPASHFTNRRNPNACEYASHWPTPRHLRKRAHAAR